MFCGKKDRGSGGKSALCWDKLPKKWEKCCLPSAWENYILTVKTTAPVALLALVCCCVPTFSKRNKQLHYRGKIGLISLLAASAPKIPRLLVRGRQNSIVTHCCRAAPLFNTQLIHFPLQHFFLMVILCVIFFHVAVTGFWSSCYNWTPKVWATWRTRGVDSQITFLSRNLQSQSLELPVFFLDKYQ